MKPQEIQLTGSTTKAVHVLTDGCRSIMLLIDAILSVDAAAHPPLPRYLSGYCIHLKQPGCHSLAPSSMVGELASDRLPLPTNVGYSVTDILQPINMGR